MTEQALNCRISEVTLQRARQQVLAILLLIPAGMVTMLFWGPKLGDRMDGITLCILAVILIIIESVAIIEANVLIRKRKEVVLALTSVGIERTSGSYSEKIAYPEIEGVEILEFPSGEIAEIRIRMRNRRLVALQGFDCMGEIVARLENSISDRSFLHRKRLAANWNQPIALIAIFVIFFAGFMFAGKWITSVHRLIPMLVFLGYGIYSLSSRPITQRLGKRFEAFEVILAIGLILSGFVSLALLILVNL